MLCRLSLYLVKLYTFFIIFLTIIKYSFQAPLPPQNFSILSVKILQVNQREKRYNTHLTLILLIRNIFFVKYQKFLFERLEFTLNIEKYSFIKSGQTIFKQISAC